MKRLLCCGLWLVLTPPVATRAADWVEERTIGVFVIHAEFAIADIAELVTELGELQKDIESTLELKCRERPIHIHFFRDKWRYRQFARRNVPEGADRQALFVAGNDAGRVYIHRGGFIHRDMAVDLRHETTHALLHNALPYVPIWLDEGIAEYFEQPARRRADGHPGYTDVRNIRAGNVKRLAQLEAIQKLSQFQHDEYRDSWAWVHFLLHGPPEARAALQEYFATIPTGREPTPLSVSLKRRLPDLEDRFAKHFR